MFNLLLQRAVFERMRLIERIKSPFFSVLRKTRPGAGNGTRHQANGKAERFIRTALRDWACAQAKPT
ncbi:hypothetical protein MES5069_220204 [Mesorhizobium escarrei]|uniref:Transposase n=1 Tax=Mesorhizobium escarrei TaxID=666018 RepID=A0ABM9DS72_9HYPH|nr:hypothetical protein MES5069_220204 [Mesorhizobium escarrei]